MSDTSKVWRGHRGSLKTVGEKGLSFCLRDYFPSRLGGVRSPSRDTFTEIVTSQEKRVHEPSEADRDKVECTVCVRVLTSRQPPGVFCSYTNPFCHGGKQTIKGIFVGTEHCSGNEPSRKN